MRILKRDVRHLTIFGHLLLLLGFQRALAMRLRIPRGHIVLSRHVLNYGATIAGQEATKILRDAGVRFRSVSRDNSITFAKLPLGWQFKLVDETRGQRGAIVDAKGRRRATISYDPSFRGVFLECRYKTSSDEERERAGEAVGLVLDGTSVIHRTKPRPITRSRDRHGFILRARQRAGRWLDKNYPDWKHPGAYWDK